MWGTAQPRSLQEEMGLSYSDGVCPGEEEAAAATPAAPGPTEAGSQTEVAVGIGPQTTPRAFL